MALRQGKRRLNEQIVGRVLSHNILAAAVTAPSEVLYSRAAVDDRPGSRAETLATFPEDGDTLQNRMNFACGKDTAQRAL